VNLTQQLDSLFNKWELVYPANFSRDGIVCEQDFANARFRILFTLKEPNSHTEDIRTHARTFSSQSGTWRNLAYWSRGILDGFPAFKEIVTQAEVNRAALAKTAVVNLKKTSGKASAIYHEIEKFVADGKNQELFTEEVSMINPDVHRLLRRCGGEFRPASPIPSSGMEEI
jgi:hypothetical protein